jgi:general secretion pathway protein F
MPRFRYTAYNPSGVRQQGEIEADSETTARAQLTDEQLMIADIALKTDASQGDLFGSGTLTLRDIEFFVSELSLLLNSGLKIDKGMQILRKNVTKPAMQDLLHRLLNDLKQGSPLSDALSHHPEFDALFVGLVRIGEETGDLAGVFRRLSTELKYRMELNDKVRQALVYPAVILTVSVLALVFIFNYVVPNLTTLFREDQVLPGYTVALLSLSRFMQQYQIHLGVGVLGLGVALWSVRHQPSFKQTLHHICETLPVLSGVTLLVERIRFNSALATMLSAGVAIDRALKLAAQTLKAASLKQELSRATEQIKRGQGLSRSLGETRLYPPYFAALLAIGEESGSLGGVFEEIAERSRHQFYQWVSRFTSLLEPLLILFMGAVVGGIVVVMMLSITAVTDISL